MKLIKDLDGNVIYEKGSYTQLFGILAQKYLPHKALSTFITKNICAKKGKSILKSDILSFIQNYEVKWEEAENCRNLSGAEECVNKFKTLNDFFIRKKRKELINIYKKNNSKFLVSPADCRTLIFKNVKDAKRLWMKGTLFTINNMLQLNKKEEKYYSNSTIIISRLAPVDYHRFHFPISGTFVKSYMVGKKYYSVDPIIVKSERNVYSKNIRISYFIKTKHFGIVALSIIGAICIGSIKLKKLKKGDVVKKGDELGYFQFGGSTIVMVIPFREMEYNETILKNSSKGVETYVNVGDYLCSYKNL